MSASSSASLQPRVGVAAIVLRDTRVLMGRRLEAGGDVWQFPGGGLQFGEQLFACAARETFEETGLLVECRELGPLTNTLLARPARHYLTVYVLAAWTGGEARVCEPDKCRAWDWFDWDALPEPLFAPTLQLVESGYRPSFD